jgi:hypothetical protein
MRVTRRVWFLKHMSMCRYQKIALGGFVVSVLAIGPKVASSSPAKDDGFLRAIKIRSTTFFRRECKVVCPMSRDLTVY